MFKKQICSNMIKINLGDLPYPQKLVEFQGELNTKERERKKERERVIKRERKNEWEKEGE